MRKRFAIGLLAAAVVVGLVAASRHELLRFVIRTGAAFAGYDVRIGGLEIGRGEATFRGLRVERGREPLLQVDDLTIGYSLRDLLPGSRRRFGLTAVDASGVRLTLIRSRDGTFNIPLPGAAAPSVPSPQRIDSVPIRFRLRVRGGRIELREPSAYDESARNVRVDGIHVDAAVDTSAITQYRLGGAFEERRAEPFSVVGKVDATLGFATHHATASRFPVRALANFFAQSRDVRILRGGARNFDAVLYALDVRPNVAPSYHVNLRLDVDGGRLALSALSLPIENVGGTLHVVDNAFFISGARATLAGIPLQIRGGVYDLNGAVTGGPQLRLGVWGAGDLADLRNAFGFTRDQPISGKATLGVLVQGPIADPVIVARANAARALYRSLPFDGVAAGVVYHANVVALVPLRASYGGIALGVRGTLTTGAPLRSEFAIHVAGPADRLPYLDEMLGKEPIVIDASATGKDLLFHVIGSVASERGIDRVAALLQMNENGTSLVDPFWLHSPRGDLDGSYALDRPRNSSAFWLLSDHLRMRAPAYPAFPNLSLPQMPKIDGGVVAAAIAGGGSGNHIVLGGLVSGAETSIAGVKFTRFDAALAGTMQHAPINLLRASGPWGTFRGRGEFSTQRFVAYGDYRGSFEGLAPFLGSAITGRGRLGGTVALAVEPQRIVVVGSNLSMPGATLRGVPVDRASITLAVEGDRVRVYAAHAHAAGGDVVAAGTLSLSPNSASNSNALSLVADRLKTSQLHGIGLPLDGGTIYASGDLRAGARLPAFAGGVTVNDARIAQFPIAGEADVNLSGDAVALTRMVGKIGGTYARADGTIGALSSGSPSYALRADVPAAQVARALRAFGLPNYATDGSFNGRLSVGGRSLSPTIGGTIGVPAGEVNGLPFIDGRAAIAADRSGVSISGGSVQVGTTRTRFNAVVRPGDVAMQVDAPHADLSDFNNFFDTGDTLAGSGSVRIAAAFRGKRITSSGNVNVRGFRYRNLPIGDTRAVWSSARNVVTGALDVGGTQGELRAHGSIALMPAGPLLSTLERSRFDLGASVGNLDLALWLPALGMQTLPITGRASGQATVRGTFPRIDLRGDARVAGGTLGPLTLDSADVAVHAAYRRIVIDHAEMTTPDLSASAAGSLGFDAGQPIDLQVHVATDRLAQLVYDASKVRVPITGSFESTLSVGGTYQAPTFLAGFDATSVLAYGIPVNSLFGEVRLRGRELVLSDAGVTFARGEATLAGSLPFSTAPLRFAAPDQPLSFDLDVVGLDPSIFDEALGNHTKLQGLLDGHVGLSGTIRQPVVVGRVSLTRGSYVSDLERTPLTQIIADLSFNRASGSIDRVSARAGNGTIVGSGSVEFPNGLSRDGLSLSFRAAARGAQLDLPAYGTGTLDARLALLKRPNADALLSGDATLSNATLPFASFVKAATQSSSARWAAGVPLDFDVDATVGRNVRVRGSGYGAGLDIGATGSVRLGGTLSAPTLAGTFKSTGGTLTYFDRAFRVQQGSVRFNAADGMLPTLHAVASTNVVNPDPDRARNPYGTADITITVDGPIAGLKVGLQSTPSGYSRDEILGLIAPFGGFVSGISFNRQQMLARQQPSGITPLGTLSPIPNVTLPQNSNITVGQEAFNILNAQFTAGLLAPVESTLGQGLGLSSVNVTLGHYGNVGLTATRLLGKAVSAVYAVTFGIPQIQSFGLVVQPSPATAAQLNFFYQSGPTNILQLPGSPVGYSAGYLTNQALIGNTGFSLTVQHYFW